MRSGWPPREALFAFRYRTPMTASVGLANHLPGEILWDLITRADAAMCEHKANARTRRHQVMNQLPNACKVMSSAR